MKLNLARPGTKGEHRLLFSNIDSKSDNHFYLLMTFHKSRKGGFSNPVSIDDCRLALRRYGKQYIYQDVSTLPGF